MIDLLAAIRRKPGPSDEFEAPEPADREWRELALRYLVRCSVVFLVLFGAVFFAFRWSGAAVRFGALRATGRAEATWHLKGVVRDAVSGEPIPWATVEDDPGGQPPFFRTDADLNGSFELVTLAERHRVRISAPNHRDLVAPAGRLWYLWLPSGEEHRTFVLEPDTRTTLP